MTSRNMTSRDKVLAKVRAGVAAGTPVADASIEAERRATVTARLAAPPRHLVPARAAGKSADELAALLEHWLQAAGGELVSVRAEEEVPSAVAQYLRRHNLPSRVRLGDDPRLVTLQWTGAPHVEVARGIAKPDDVTSLVHAVAAVAETGTLVLASGPDNPVTLSFLPENSIVVVARGDLVGPLEDAIAILRARTGGAATAALPRTLNLISGPSRSADIGGIPVLGAHGPRRLCVLLVG